MSSARPLRPSLVVALLLASVAGASPFSMGCSGAEDDATEPAIEVGGHAAGGSSASAAGAAGTAGTEGTAAHGGGDSGHAGAPGEGGDAGESGESGQAGEGGQAGQSDQTAGAGGGPDDAGGSTGAGGADDGGDGGSAGAAGAGEGGGAGGAGGSGGAAAGAGGAGSGGTGGAGTAGAAGAPAPVLPTSKYFDLDTPSTRLFWKKPLHDPHHIMQSFAFDQKNGRMYFAQLRDGGTGDDLCITQTDMAGNVTGYMHHDNAGHGVSIGVESVGKDSYLWVETDSNKGDDTGRGTALLRFKFVSGKKPAGTKFLTGSSTITAATDPVNERIVIRRSEGGKMTYRLFPLAAAAKGDFSKPLAVFAQPALSTKSVTFQGYTVFGQYLYTMDGTGHNDAADIDSYVTRIDMKTGKVDDRALTKAGVSLIFREPEGMAVYKTSGGELRLCMGFGSHDVVGGSNRLANVYFKNVLKP